MAGWPYGWASEAIDNSSLLIPKRLFEPAQGLTNAA
jgi:hypothetical protein